MESKRGKTIEIEGTDKSGKETQTKIVVARLNSEGIPTTSMSFPRYDTPTGRIVGECYLGRKGMASWFEDPVLLDPRIASLYYAADRRAALPDIEKTLASGTNIIFDRYVDANKGHQGGKEKDPIKRAEIIKYIDTLEHELLGLPRPDLTLFLYMPHQVGIELGKINHEIVDGHERNIDHLRMAEQTYLELAQQYNWKQINCAPDGTINSLRTKEDIAQEVYSHVRKILT